MHNVFYRNVRARDHLSLFLAATVGTVLALRLFLHITGYPQVGGGTFHIAHMLYGGLFMMAAIVLLVSFLGERIAHLASLLGGIGFGLFIDELGKFITKDNNYFFRPTIGLLYAIFAIIFLIFNYIGRRYDRLTDREYELNALNQFEEAVLQDLDPREKQQISELLANVRQPTPLSKALQDMLKIVDTVPAAKPNIVSRQLERVTRMYAKFWQRPKAGWLISVIFVVQAAVFLVSVGYALFNSFDRSVGLNASNGAYANRLLIAEFVSSAVSGILVIIGVINLRTSRQKAYEFFRISLLVNLFLTEFFVFSRIQFDALLGFTFNLLLFIALRVAQYQEKQIDRIAK